MSAIAVTARCRPRSASDWDHGKAPSCFSTGGRDSVVTRARGVTDPATALDPIVDTEGREIGIRSGFFNNMQISAAYFEIDLGSELVFVGDNGSVEPRGASERKGIEVGIFYQPREWLTIDGDYAHTTARFKEDPDGIGNIVPDSMEGRLFPERSR